MSLPPLRVPRLPDHPVCPAFADDFLAENASNVLDRSPPLRRAQKFPEAGSRRIALSSSASARSRFRRAFSFSSSFSRFAWSIRRPPNFFFHQ
jgi:hypothetical protein